MDKDAYNEKLRLEGLFGSVYKKEKKRNSRKKIIKKEFENRDPDDLEGIEQDLVTLQKLSVHQNIVSLVDFYFTDYSTLFLLEYCDDDLEGYMSKNDLNLEKRVNIVQQCADGVYFLHNLSVPFIHTDIKPSSILVKKHSHGTTVKITDFGMDTIMTKVTNPIMSMDIFKAPELLDLTQEPLYTASVDVYSLGLIFLAMYKYDKATCNTLIPFKQGFRFGYGLKLLESKMKDSKMPVLLSINCDDSLVQISIKALILKMILYECNERPSIEDVVSELDKMYPKEEQIPVIPLLEMNEEVKKDYGVYVIVAALEIGLSRCGYSFLFKSNPENIYCNKNWESEHLATYKIPTQVLIRLDGEFEAIGSKAKDRFEELNEEGVGHGYAYFEDFWYLETLCVTSILTSSVGHEFRALDVCSMVIKYLADHFIETLGKQYDLSSDLARNMVRWVINMPDMCSLDSEELIRNAAIKAGCIEKMDTDKLILVKDSLAAFSHCKTLPMTHWETPDTVQSLEWTSTGKYLVINILDHAVEFTCLYSEDDVISQVFQIPDTILPDSGYKQLESNLFSFLQKLFGKKMMNAFKQEYESNWLDVVKSFNMAVNNMQFISRDRFNLSLPWSFGGKCQEVLNLRVDQVLEEKSYYGVKFSNGFLVFTRETIVNFITPVIKEITCQVDNLINLPPIQPLVYTILVGELAQNKILQQAVQEVLPEGKLLVPIEPSLSVTKGLVLFGHNYYKVLHDVQLM